LLKEEQRPGPELIAVNQAMECDPPGFIDLAEQSRTVFAGLVHCVVILGRNFTSINVSGR
jgi:hypothetical protein